MAKHCSRKKHVDLRHTYIMDLMGQRIISLTHIPTGHMKAEFPTKPLRPTIYEWHYPPPISLYRKTQITSLCVEYEMPDRKRAGWIQLFTYTSIQNFFGNRSVQ